MSEFRQQVIDLFDSHQINGRFHPFTCGNPTHDWREANSWTTLAPVERDGDVWLVCYCGYEQRMTAFDAIMVASIAQAAEEF